MKTIHGTAYGLRRTFRQRSAWSVQRSGCCFSNCTLSAIRCALILPLFILLLSVYFLLTPSLYAATGEKAMVVTPDTRATQAALEVLKQGGNAVDAAVTAGWVMSVVSPQSSGPGAGGLFLFYDIGTRRILFFDGSVKAPAKVRPGMFLDEQGQLLTYQPDRNTGGLPVGVPGFLKLTEEVHGRYGTYKFPFATLFEPAVLLAEEGTEVSAGLAEAIRENSQRLGLLDPEKEVFFREGTPLAAGEMLQQPGLAKAFRLIQKRGASIFYRGAIATAMTRAVRKNKFRPGFMNNRDLENYTAAEREPVHATYQGYDLFSAGPPADGGVMLFRALNVLSHFGIPGLGRSPEAYHLLGETQKAAMTYRGGVADPDLFEIPLKELLSEAWAQDRAGAISFERILKPVAMKPRDVRNGENRSGISILVVDPQGNLAILTATLGDSFGSALRVPGYGFFLNDLLTDFDAGDTGEGTLSPEVISGGQRPRGPEAPVFFFKDGKPELLANAYGPEDPAAVLLSGIVQRIDLGASCAGALESPRLLTGGDGLRLEQRLYDQEMVRLKLELLGHKIEKEDSIGFAQMVCIDPVSGKIDGESDLRGQGEAAGF